MKIIGLLLVITILGVGIFTLIPQADAASGVKVWFCMNKPWSLFNAEEKHYHVEDQTALKSEVVRNCDEAPKNIVWSPHANVYVLVFAPQYNQDPYVMDTIGKEEHNEITCGGTEDGDISIIDGSSVGMKEIGIDTGIFGGRIKLAGDMLRTVDGDVTTFGSNSVNPRTASALDRGSMCNLKTTADGGFTWTWEYSEGEFITKTGKYSFREGQIRFDKDIYQIDDKVKIILDDIDLLRWTFDSKTNYVDVWSDTDPSGITAKVIFKRDWWKAATYDGTHYATIDLVTKGESKSNNNLRTSPGDNIYVRYYDYTLPAPYSEDDCTKKFNRGPINNPTLDCEHLAIENFAKVVSGNSLLLSSNSDVDIPVPGYSVLTETTAVLIPSKTSLSKYTLDGESKLYFWWEPIGAPITNTEYDLNLLFHEAKRDVIQEGITYDLEIKFNDKIIESSKNIDVSGKIKEKFLFDEPGMMKIQITNIDGEDREQDFTIVVKEKPTLYLTGNTQTHQENSETLESPIVETNSNPSIPDWIKINAKWWSDKTINDQEFAQGIEYMIQEKIIIVSSSEKSNNDVDDISIPMWVRYNTEWWSEGIIGDVEFLSGLEYLINNGLIKV